MPWFIRLAQRWRPPEGWPVFCLAWAAVLCLPAAAIDVQWLAGMEAGVWLATLAFLLGWRLGHAGRLHGAAAAAGLGLTGVLAVLLWGVQVLDPARLWLAAGELGHHLVWWLDLQRLRALAPFLGPAPVHPPPNLSWQNASAQWSALADFASRVSWWLDGLLGSRPAVPDALVVAGFALGLIWLTAAWAGWHISRRGLPFAALLPAAVLLAVQAFLVNRGLIWLLILLASWPVLLALVRSHWLMRSWEAERIDYSPEFTLGAGLAGGVVAMIIFLAAPALPYLTSREAAESFWRLFQQPYRQVEQRVNQSFPAAPGARSLAPVGGVALGGLPRSHLLGGRPELGRQVALRVTVRGARPGDILYWRGQTFAAFDGRGWHSEPADTRLENLQAGQAWTAESFVARHTVLSLIEVRAATIGVLYAPGEPISVDRPYQAITRFPGDLDHLQSPGGPTTYTVLSAVPDQNANALDATGTQYPPPVSAVYLQLPADLPPAVRDYAHRLTASARTPYQAAIALEKALREIPYSLDVPTPPPGRDLVSWFLFDLRRGYCDYYASAMVVLARAAGIPARLAVGYATGAYDARQGRYQVTELQAHSWPELYFPRIGWVPFEPTAGVPALERLPGAVPAALLNGSPPPDLRGPELDELQARGQAYTAEERQRRRLGWALAGLDALVLAWAAWRLQRLRFVVTADTATQEYLRLAAWGRRLGRPALASETPHEFAAVMAALVSAAAARSRLDPAGASRAAAAARQGAERLAGDFEAAVYSGDARPAAQRRLPGKPAGLDRWAPLWTALRRLWLARRWRI